MSEFSFPCASCAGGDHGACTHGLCGCIVVHDGDDQVLRGFKAMKQQLHPERAGWTEGGFAPRPGRPAGFPLVVQAGTGDARVFAGQFTIGTQGDLKVAGALVSPKHAACFPLGPDWVIADLGSVAGTRVNGVQVAGTRPLAKGDKVQVGHTVLTMVPAG